MRDAFSDRKLLRRSLNFISDSILQITWRFANLGSGSTHILNKSQALLLDLHSICETNRKLLFLDLHKLSSLPTLGLLRSIVGTSFVGQGHYGTRPCVHFIPMYSVPGRPTPP